MDPYASEKEQIEAIRTWWRENGKAIVAGVVLGLAGLLGWRYWQHYGQARADHAAMEYARMSAAIAQGKDEGARQWGRQIIADYASTPYATLAAFAIARLDIDAGHTQAAERRLQWAFDQAGDEDLRRVAALRLARVQLSAGRLEAAGKTLATVPPGGFAAEFYQVEGDVYVARGDKAKARAAYEAALKALPKDAPAEQRRWLEVKLDNLGAAPSAKAAS